jgi:uncharacterized protein with FMN-binding domain
MNRKLATLIFAGLATAPIAGTWSPTPTLAASAKAAKSFTYRGSTFNTTWGPIQVIVTVKSKKITKVSVVDPTHTARSQVIASSAIPTLVQETLQAQSARIDTVSGATTISQAYIKSLQSALKSAHLA